MEPEEIVVTVEVPPVVEPEPVAEVAPVVVVAAETPVDALVELAARVGALEARMDAQAFAIVEVETDAIIAQNTADAAVEIAVETAVEVEEEIPESDIPEIEEISPDVVAQEMPEIETRGRRKSYFI